MRNIEADYIIGANASITKKINIKNTTIAVYVNAQYIPKNYANIIESHCGAQEAREFLQKKYKCTKVTMEDIKCKLHANFIQRQAYARKKILLKFVHRWLAPGNKSFGQMIECPSDAPT